MFRTDDRQINEVHAIPEDEVLAAARPQSMAEIIADARLRHDAAPPGDPIRSLTGWLERHEGLVAGEGGAT